MFLASTRAYSAVQLPARVAFAFPVVSIVRIRVYFTPFDRARSAFPCRCVAPPAFSDRARVLPRFVVFPRLTSAPRARVLSYSIPHSSPLPLSRDASQLVTSSCRVQVGCSGHHSPHNTHISPRVRERSADLTPSLTILRHY